MTTLLTDVAWISLSTGTALLVVAAVMRYRRNRAVKKRLAELDRLDTANAQVNMWGPAAGIFGDLSGVDALMDQMEADDAPVYVDLGRRRRDVWRARLWRLNPWARRRSLEQEIERLQSSIRVMSHTIERMQDDLHAAEDQRTLVAIEGVSPVTLFVRWPTQMNVPVVGDELEVPSRIGGTMAVVTSTRVRVAYGERAVVCVKVAPDAARGGDITAASKPSAP